MIIYGNVHRKIIVKVFNQIYCFINDRFLISDNTTTLNYTTQFIGVQYFVDLSIIQYVTNINQSESSVS